MTPENFDDKLDLFYGGATANRVTVYARLREKLDGEGWSLSGTVRGPHCLYSTTLPATIPLVDAGPGETLLAKALVPDPCYWTAELPFLYDVHVELKQQGRVVAETDRLLGIRNFGPRGRFFYDQGKRRVIRAAFTLASRVSQTQLSSLTTLTPAPRIDLLQARDTPLDLCVSEPTDAFCEEASRVGVLLIASVAHSHDAAAMIRRLARHASVAVINLGGEQIPDWAAMRRLAPNTVLATDSVWEREGSDCCIKDMSNGQPLGKWPTSDMPTIVRSLILEDVAMEPTALRSRCDELQATAAQHGDFAGYCVHPPFFSNSQDHA